jgi:uncharacterized protein (DUF1015 family)
MYFMAIYYPETNLKILDYNRVLKSLNGLSNEEFLAKIAESYDVNEPLDASENPYPREKGECSLYLGG